jgi:hypothetical protein
MCCASAYASPSTYRRSGAAKTSARTCWHNPTVAKPRNVAREIVVSLVAGAVFAVGFYVYLERSMPVLSGSRLVAPPTAAGQPDDLQLASDVARRFVAALHSGRHADAYALMASPYRERFSLTQFRAQCAAAEFLARSERVALSRTRRSVPPGISATHTSLVGQGALVSALGSLDVSFTFVGEPTGELKILVLALAGSPILDGVSARR